MARKTSKSSQSEKKHSAIPPKKAAKQAVAVAAAAPVVEAVMTAPTVSVEPIIVALHDLDADNAREAATSLGLAGDVKAVEPLIEVLSNSNGYFHSVVRCAAATSLAQLKDARAVEPLLKAVHDPIAEPSCEAIRALASLAEPGAVAKLIEVVRNQNGFFVGSVRRAAVLGLAKIGGPAAIAELTRVSADPSEDHVIREEATAAVPAK